MAGYRELEHTADWELEAWADDLPGLLEQAARGMYALSGVRLDGGSGYLLPFVIVSVHLLVVLIGAAYLARAKRPADKE